MYGSAYGSVKRRNRCAGEAQAEEDRRRRSARRRRGPPTAWMKIAAKPAVSSSDAGISASSSRLRALTEIRPCSSSMTRSSASSLDRSLWSVNVAAAVRGHLLDRHAGGVVPAVELDPERQLVRQPAVDGDHVARGFVDADEVDRARRGPEAASRPMTQPSTRTRPGVTRRRRRRRCALAAAARAPGGSSIGCARGRTADSATVPAARYSASARRGAGRGRPRRCACGLRPAHAWRGVVAASP